MIDARKHGLRTENSPELNQIALGQALDAACAKGERLYIPSGRYRYRGLTKRFDYCTLAGDGPSTVLMPMRTNAPPVVESLRLVGNKITVRDLHIREGNPTTYQHEHIAHPGMTGIRIGGSPGSWMGEATVENVTATDIIGQAVVVYYTSNARVSGAHVYRCGEGIAIENCRRNAVVTGSTVEDSADDLIIVKAASDHGAGQMLNASVSDCHVRNGDAKGITLMGTKRASVTGCTVDYVNQLGIAVADDPGYPNLLSASEAIVNGCTVTNAGRWYGQDPTRYLYKAPNSGAAGIMALSAHETSILGCQVYDTAGPGIIAQGSCHRFEAAHNRVYRATKAGIVFGSPDGSDTTRFLEPSITHNRTWQTVGGIVGGEATDAEIAHNRIRSYRNGALGERMGILLGAINGLDYGPNLIRNDDGGGRELVIYPNVTNVRQH